MPGKCSKEQKKILPVHGYTVNLTLILVLLCGFLVYLPGLNGPFVFDDGPNISENPALRISSLTFEELNTAINAVHAGPLGRPIGYTSFALNYYFFGPETFSFKFTNVIIHLANGFTVFILTRLLLRGFRFAHRVNLSKQRIRWIALSISSLWMLHPLALTTVFLVVQRMTSFSALFTMWTIIFYVCGRLQQMAGQSGLMPAAFGLFFCAPLAVLSKENAVLIPYFLVVTEFCLLRYKTRTKDFRILFGGILLIAVIPLFGILFTFESLWSWLSRSYEIRPYTLYEHVLTESRVIWFYLKLIFIPHPADYGLYHDDFTLSKGLFQPFTTIVSVVGLVILATGAILVRKKVPVLSFAILFFLVGHSIESSIFSLEIAHEHRNYLPMYGMIFMFAYYGLHPRLIHHGGRVVIAGFIVLVGLFATITMNRALDWSDIGTLSLSLAEHHPNSARSNYEAGRLLTQLIEDDLQSPETGRYYRIARQYFTQAYRSDEFNPSGLFGILYLDGLTGKLTNMDTVTQLIHRLSKHPILPASETSFTYLHKCHHQGTCRIETDIMIRLYESALSNELASAKTHASLFNELAILKLGQGNTTSAIKLFRQSIASTPKQPQLRFNLIYVLITSGRLNEAHQELVSIRENFLNVRERDKLARLEKMHTDATQISDY